MAPWWRPAFEVVLVHVGFVVDKDKVTLEKCFFFPGTSVGHCQRHFTSNPYER